MVNNFLNDDKSLHAYEGREHLLTLGGCAKWYSNYGNQCGGY